MGGEQNNDFEMKNLYPKTPSFDAVESQGQRVKYEDRRMSGANLTLRCFETKRFRTKFFKAKSLFWTPPLSSDIHLKVIFGFIPLRPVQKTDATEIRQIEGVVKYHINVEGQQFRILFNTLSSISSRAAGISEMVV